MTENKSAATEDVAAKLRAPFPAEQVGKLPRVTCGDCSDRRKNCEKHTKSKCNVCQGYVSTQHIHLDYVGHADVTSRLLEADPDWNWEPKAEDENGLPVFDTDDNGNPVGLWIKLTAGGVTRLGYGSCPSGQNDAVKVLIGDALRNAAMRFGVALDLWAKGDRADPAAENATASGGHAQRRRPQQRQDESWRDQPPVNGSREQSRPPENSEQVDDGEWGDWRERISAIASAEDANKLDAELRGAFKTGKVNPAKANNIRAAIQAKAASLTQEATEATPAEGEAHEYDPLAQRFAGEAMAAADADALERIHNRARSAKRLSTFVKLEDPEYAGTLLSLVQARRAELEQAPAANGQPVGAQA